MKRWVQVRIIDREVVGWWIFKRVRLTIEVEDPDVIPTAKRGTLDVPTSSHSSLLYPGDRCRIQFYEKDNGKWSPVREE